MSEVVGPGDRVVLVCLQAALEHRCVANSSALRRVLLVLVFTTVGVAEWPTTRRWWRGRSRASAVRIVSAALLVGVPVRNVAPAARFSRTSACRIGLGLFSARA